jgi:putative tryptophan/tyrosine transport system substrate-binding protein
MRRREVIAGLGAALCCSPRALAQATARVYRVGLLSTLAPISNESEQGAAFISAMSRAGYVLGQNLILERRGAMGQVERLPALVQELIEARVDVLVVNGYRTAVARRRAAIRRLPPPAPETPC